MQTRNDQVGFSYSTFHAIAAPITSNANSTKVEFRALSNMALSHSNDWRLRSGRS